MRRRVHIALAALLVLGALLVAHRVLRQKEPVYQGKALRFWLREYYGWDATPQQWAEAKKRAEQAVRQIGTNAIPSLLEMVRKTESPCMSKLTDAWDRHIIWRKGLPASLRHPTWYKDQPRFLTTYGEIGFRILGPEAAQAVPDLMSIYEQTAPLDPVPAMFPRGAVVHSLIYIGPPAIPYLLRRIGGTNEDERLCAAHILSKMHARPSVAVPVLVDFLSHTNLLMRVEVVESLGAFGADARQATPALIPLLSDPKGIVRRAATNALKAIGAEAAPKAGVK